MVPTSDQVEDFGTVGETQFFQRCHGGGLRLSAREHEIAWAGKVGRFLEARYKWRQALNMGIEDKYATIIAEKMADGLE